MTQLTIVGRAKRRFVNSRQAPAGAGWDIATAASRPRPDFDLQVTAGQGRVTVRVSGEVDLATSGELERAVVAILVRGCARVTVDLRAVSFLDCTGIRALLAVHQRALELAAVVSLIVPGGQVGRVLELTGMADHLNLEGVPDERSAKADQGVYHEIRNDPERDEVLAEIRRWLAARVGSGAAAGSSTS